MHQDHTAPFPFSVVDVVRMGRAPHLRRFADPSSRDTERALAVLRRLGLEHLADTPYTSVSGGERHPDHPPLLDSDMAMLVEGRVRARGPATSTITRENLRLTYELDIHVADVELLDGAGSVRVCYPLVGRRLRGPQRSWPVSRSARRVRRTA